MWTTRCIYRDAKGEQTRGYRTRYHQLQSSLVLLKGDGNQPYATSCHLTRSSPLKKDCNLSLSPLTWSHLQTRSHSLRLVPQSYWQNEFPPHRYPRCRDSKSIPNIKSSEPLSFIKEEVRTCRRTHHILMALLIS